MKKAVLFDFDGTMVDTQLLYDLAASEALCKVDEKYNFEYCSQYFNGRGWKDVFAEIGKQDPKLKVENVFMDALKIAHDLTNTLTKPNKNLVSTLNSLSKMNIKFVICSNAKRAEIRKKLKIVKLEDYFTEAEVFTFESSGNSKPKPDVYLEAINFLNLKPEEALIIEDSKAGVLAGINANIETLFYTGGGHHAKNPSLAKNLLETLNSSYIKGTINDLKEIVNFIK